MVLTFSQKIMSAIDDIDRPTSYCAGGLLSGILPGLEIKGVGPIALPLIKSQAMLIKNQATQAPYGKGEETIVDSSVRRVWEVDAEHVSLNNPEWNKLVQKAIKAFRNEVGLKKQKLESHLYKLLLYEKGSFFLSHQDGEKLDRMVATLVIVLPSEHEGGELVIRHEGTQQTFDFGGIENQYATQFAAFYADCEHEILPVKQGFRLSLIYNLTLRKTEEIIKAPTSGRHIEKIAKLFQEWKPTETINKLAITLSHQYTEKGLTFDALKGIDRARTQIIFAAGHQAGFKVHLALLTLWQMGSAYEDYYPQYYGDNDPQDEPHTMSEVLDESLVASNWIDEEGQSVLFGVIPFDETEILSDESLEESEPDEEDYAGFTGNAGATLERWYHRAVVVLWTPDQHFDVLCSGGIDSAVAALDRMVKDWTKAKRTEKETVKKECIDFANRIIASWPERKYRSRYSVSYSHTTHRESQEVVPLLPLLGKLGNTLLISQWIKQVLGRDVSIEPGKALGNICKQQGWITFEDELKDVFRKTDNESVERNAHIIAELCKRKERDPDREELCNQLVSILLTSLKVLAVNKEEEEYSNTAVDRSKLIVELFQSCAVLVEPMYLEQLIQQIIGYSKYYPVTTIQMPALIKLSPWIKQKRKGFSPSLEKWLSFLLKTLEYRESHPPVKPKDWKRNANVNCTCENCKELSSFLRDRNTEALRFRMRQDMRSHVENQIRADRCDITCSTDRKGSPHTLVCTKNDTSYQNKLKAHLVDLDHLKNVQVLHDWLEREKRTTSKNSKKDRNSF